MHLPFSCTSLFWWHSLGPTVLSVWYPLKGPLDLHFAFCFGGLGIVFFQNSEISFQKCLILQCICLISMSQLYKLLNTTGLVFSLLFEVINE